MVCALGSNADPVGTLRNSFCAVVGFATPALKGSDMIAPRPSTLQSNTRSYHTPHTRVSHHLSFSPTPTPLTPPSHPRLFHSFAPASKLGPLPVASRRQQQRGLVEERRAALPLHVVPRPPLRRDHLDALRRPEHHTDGDGAGSVVPSHLRVGRNGGGVVVLVPVFVEGGVGA